MRAIPSSAGWKCPQCATRAFTTSARRAQVGPEHPRYIEVPEPPQQTVQYRPPLKGTLPVPRNIFSGHTKDNSSLDFVAKSTRPPTKPSSFARGSREEWKARMGDVRRQNLREGIRSLKSRQDFEQEKSRSKTVVSQRARQEALERPEREDERLTAPSTNFNLESLMKGHVRDPFREERWRIKKENVERLKLMKREKRLDDLHTLYMNARTFIVTPEQLDKHVEEVFGTDEEPIIFGASHDVEKRNSIWASGKPMSIQEILNTDVNKVQFHAVESVHQADWKMQRLAETLTGGKMDPKE